MRMLKIGFVLDDTLDTPDGVQQYVLTLGAWLRAQGHEVHYLVGETARTDLEHIHSLSRNFRVRYNGNRLSIPLPAARSKLRRLLETEKFDVLHVQMPYSPWLAHRIIRVAPRGMVIVGTFHVLPYSRATHAANRLLAFGLRSTLKRFNHIFAVSEAAQAFARRVYGVESTILPNVVDQARFREAEPLPEYRGDTLTIMFLGRLVPRKGARTLLEAASMLRERHNLPPFRVVVCGKGPLDAELRQYVAAHSLKKVVSFTGFVSEDAKPRFIASADIMVFPSSSGESFGIVLIEAMSSGRPLVLAGDNPGYRSVLALRPELLFAPRSPAELADKLSAYLLDTRAQRSAIDWQKEYARQFDVAAVGGNLLKIYAELLQHAR